MADNEQNINKEPATNATDSVKTQLNDNQQNVQKLNTAKAKNDGGKKGCC